MDPQKRTSLQALARDQGALGRTGRKLSLKGVMLGGGLRKGLRNCSEDKTVKPAVTNQAGVYVRPWRDQSAPVLLSWKSWAK